MKNLLLLLLALFSACTSKDREKQLVIGSDGAYYPYEYYDQFSTLKGFDIDFARMLATHLNKELVIKTMPFAEQSDTLQRGEIDILLNGMTITPAREKELFFVPYHKNPVQKYFLAFWLSIPAGITSIDSFKDRPDLTISAQTGTLKADYLATLPNIHIRTKDDSRDIFYDLKRERITAILLEPEEAHYLQDRYPEIRLIEVPLPEQWWTDELGIAIKKDNVKMQQEIAQAIKELRENGKLKELEHAWFKRLH